MNTHRYWVNRGDGDCEEFLGVPGGLLNTLGRDVIHSRIVDIRHLNTATTICFLDSAFNISVAQFVYVL